MYNKNLLLLISGLLALMVVYSGCSESNNTADGDTDVENNDSDLADGDIDDAELDTDDASEEEANDTDSENDTEQETALYPACGSGTYNAKYLIAGPAEDEYDQTLADLARKYDRQYNQFNGKPAGVMIDLGIDPEATIEIEGETVLKRKLVEDWLNNDDGWDFEAYSGVDPVELLDSVEKVAGLYGGAGAVADALRYAVLRDQGADCQEIETAREHLLTALDAVHRAFAIGGVPGVVARGFARKDLPGLAPAAYANGEVLPLFDENNNPLPEEKDNGTWREDNSGLYPDYIWEDSCSRDMMLGWAAASGIAMEVIKDDPAFSDEIKDRIRNDAKAVGQELRKQKCKTVNGAEICHDLEFLDADGRTTYHGFLHHEALERLEGGDIIYIPGFENGFYSLMALGIVGAFAYASDDPEAWDYLDNELLKNRKLADIVLDSMVYINMDKATNFSNYNMAFISAWLALRYIKDETARAKIIEATKTQLYDTPGERFQPVEQKMSMYDFVYISSLLDGSAFMEPAGQIDETALANGVETLSEYTVPPYWDYPIENCDEAELESGDCTLLDGTQVKVYFEGGRKGSTICDTPVPKKIRRPSNFEWRSNPYNPNGGGNGRSLFSGVSFRLAYWMGRWTKVSD